MDKKDKEEIAQIVANLLKEQKKPSTTSKTASKIAKKLKDTDWVDKEIQALLTTINIEVKDFIKSKLGARY